MDIVKDNNSFIPTTRHYCLHYNGNGAASNYLNIRHGNGGGTGQTGQSLMRKGNGVGTGRNISNYAFLFATTFEGAIALSLVNTGVSYGPPT